MSSAVISQISKLGFNVSREWVDACLEFCQSQDPAPTGQALLNAVIEQWMNADITVEGTQTGPQIQRIFSQDVPKGPPLDGKYCLQVQKAIDVGQDSAYSQLQTALKVRNENSLVSADIDTQRPYTAAWEPKSKRMLKLSLTDGFRTVAALEFEPIPQLKYPVPPGLKLEVRGPVVVRRGVLLLNPRNVRILGGHVSELEEKCSLVQQLTDVLGQDNVSVLVASHTNRPTTHVLQNPSNRGDNEVLFAEDEDELFNMIDDPSFATATTSSSATSSASIAMNVNQNGFSNVQPYQTNNWANRKVPNLALNNPPAAKSQTVKPKPVKKEPKGSQRVKKEPKTSQPTQKKVPKLPQAKLVSKKQLAKSAKSLNKKVASPWDDDDNDDFFPDDDEALLLCAAEAEEATFNSAPVSAKSTSQKRVPKIPASNPNFGNFSGSVFPDDDLLFCAAVDSWSEEPPVVKKEKFSQQASSSFKQTSISNFLAPSKVEKKSQVISTEPAWPIKQEKVDSCFSSAKDEQLPNSTQTATNIINNKPFTYLCHIAKNTDTVEVVKGCVVSLASKLNTVESATGRAWQVRVTFTDGTDTLVATLAASMITDTFGFTPTDYSKMPTDQKKLTMKEATSKLSSKLLNFNGLVKLKFRKNFPEPEMIEMTPVNRGHMQQLKIRVNKNNS